MFIIFLIKIGFNDKKTKFKILHPSAKNLKYQDIKPRLSADW